MRLSKHFLSPKKSGVCGEVMNLGVSKNTNLRQFMPICANFRQLTPIYANVRQLTPIYANLSQFTPIFGAFAGESRWQFSTETRKSKALCRNVAQKFLTEWFLQNDP
jgi:hypothetical protein